MSDDKTDRGAQDRARINVPEEHEVRYWTKELGVTADELQRVVGKVGVSVDGLRACLKEQKRRTV